MSDGMTVLVAVLGSSAFSIVVKEIIDSRKAKKRGIDTIGAQIQELSGKIDEQDNKIADHINGQNEKFAEKFETMEKKIDDRIDTLEAKLDNQKDAVEKQHLDVLRLTIMSPNMPVSERLIAGAEYIKKGGNGDVKKYVHELEKQCQSGMTK